MKVCFCSEQTNVCDARLSFLQRSLAIGRTATLTRKEDITNMYLGNFHDSALASAIQALVRVTFVKADFSER